MFIKVLHLTVIGLLISGISFSQTAVKKVTSNVAIDGQLEESFWDISNQLTIGSSNNVANFGVLWDDDFLYVGVNVEDAILCNNGRQGFYDDGVEICIDGNNSKGTAFDKYDRIFVKPINSYWIQEMEQRYDGVIHKWIETSNGYSMELAIPWSNFNVTPASGIKIGFNIIVNDDEYSNNTSNKPEIKLWSGNSGYYVNPSVWGELELSSQTVSFTGNYLALINPNGGDFYINGKTTIINWLSNNISNINIDYSTDNGNNWNSIATNIPANSGQFSWNVTATPSDNCLIKIYETGNSSLNDISESQFSISEALSAVEPLIPNTWDNYMWPYNAYFPEDENGINGHVGSACGHASLARILHYWEFPIVGNDQLTFQDNAGHTWSANFGATTYNYDNMPGYLPENSTEPEYKDVATLTYHAATSMHDIYGSGGDLTKMSYAMSHYFNYKESTSALRFNYTKAQWVNLVMNELDNGRVLLVQGMTTEVLGDWHENNWIAGHWFHIDGYNEDGLFHGVLGFGDEDAYFDIESLFGYYLNNGILIGLEPNLNGKELSLLSNNGGENLESGKVIEVLWNSLNITNVRIEYTVDNGQNWIELISSISASSESYDWTTPDINSDKCKIKITDVSDINVYDKSNEEFSISSYEIVLSSPNGGEFYLANEIAKIRWENTPVSDIKIEYSIDDGAEWKEIVASIPSSSGSYDWAIPNVKSNKCLVKISDASNISIFDESENNFEIGQANNAGGPYLTDENTVLLLHFNGDLKEESNNYTVVNHGIAKTFISNPIKELNEAIYFDNSIQGNQSSITIPNTDKLNLIGNWTIDFWIYINSWNQSHNSWPVPLVLPTTGWDSNYFLEIPSTEGKLKYGFKSSDGGAMIYSSQNSITTKKWYHVALINDYDNHTIKLVLRDVNFQEIEEKSANYTSGTIISTGTQDLKIAFGTAGDNYLDGYMDELRISNVVRTFENRMKISENYSDNQFSIYPNPTVKSVYIEGPEKVELSILTITGQKIFEKKNFRSGIIDTSKFKKGIYVVMFNGEGGVVSKKIIIE